LAGHQRVAALIVAAGRGIRAGGTDNVVPKQYQMLGEEAVLVRTMRCFEAHDAVDAILTVIHADDATLYEAHVGKRFTKLLSPVTGGATRQSSVRQGLLALAEHGPFQHVLIHDAARPNVDGTTIGQVVAALANAPAAIAAVPLADTLKRAGDGGKVTETLERAGLWRAQTPQGFHFATAIAMHKAAADAGRDDFTDDAAVAEWQGIPVVLVPGHEDNRKITTESDLRSMQSRRHQVAQNASIGEVRTGQGFDVHRFKPGDHVFLCGVRLPHTHALDGHSDADVALHALTDALLGAIGDGDIGQHFPPSDDRWKGAASALFLKDAVRRVAARGGRILNVDLTILCEAPRIGPHRERMRDTLAQVLAIAADRVNVKATTTEQLGFTGRKEGIAAMAIATVALPGSPEAP